MKATVLISQGIGDHGQYHITYDEQRRPYCMGMPAAEGEALAPCPFCGCDYADTEESSGLEVCNTYTPSYWVQCNACGAEKHTGEREMPDSIILPQGQKGYTEQMFIDARAAAVDAWNTRDTRWQTGS